MRAERSRTAGCVLALATLAAACSGKPKDVSQDVRGGIARTITAPGSGRAHAPATAPAPGALDYLSAYQGRTASDSGLWTTRPLHDRLVAMLGEDYDRFIEALPPVKLANDGGVYYVAGPTARGIAAVVMDARADSVYAIEQDGSGRREYLERSHKPALPAAVQALLRSMPLR